MSNTKNEALDPKDPKNIHLHHLYPYIIYCRNFGPNSPTVQEWDQELISSFDFKRDFSDYVNTHIKEIAIEFDARWIAAICDVYIDCSNNSEERLAALLISSFIRQTQIATTHLYWRGGMHPEYELTKELHSKSNLHEKYDNTTVLWSGMHGVIGDDIYRNLFYRVNSSLKHMPVFLKLFKKVIRSLLIENTVVYPLGLKEKLTDNTSRYLRVLNNYTE